ncbi:MAG TPA: histidine triad nucleotide-binding protein [Candidatus Eremiobacteraceae bacterium]|nr:histidine triad nucleotide-binding protein [Candidatus Eremiobacteraceae bacterium]
MAETCIFCEIAAGRIPAQKLYEDDVAIAFRDLKPMAPTHILVVPKAHHAKLQDATHDQALLGRLLSIAGTLVKDGGFRVIVNNGAEAGQTVYHLHLHVLSGRHFGWPPG